MLCALGYLFFFESSTGSAKGLPVDREPYSLKG